MLCQPAGMHECKSEQQACRNVVRVLDCACGQPHQLSCVAIQPHQYLQQAECNCSKQSARPTSPRRGELPPRHMHSSSKLGLQLHLPIVQYGQHVWSIVCAWSRAVIVSIGCKFRKEVGLTCCTHPESVCCGCMCQLSLCLQDGASAHLCWWLQQRPGPQ